MKGFKPDPLIRRPMQWSGERHAGFSSHRPWQELHPEWRQAHAAVQSTDPTSLLALYRRLIRLRSSRPALRRGRLTAVASTDARVWAALRELPEERLLVVINLSDEPIADYSLAPPDGAWVAASVAGEILQRAEVTGAPTAAWTPLAQLAANTTYVIELQPESPD